MKSPPLSRLAPRLALLRENGALAGLCLAAGAAFAFLTIAGEAAEGETHGFDTWLLLALRTPGAPDDPIGPPWFEAAVADVTSLGGYAVLSLVTTLAVGFMLAAEKVRNAALTAGAIASGAMLSESLKLGYARPRPDLVAQAVEVHSLSLPSGHAMLSAIAYLTLAALIARLVERRQLKTYVIGAAILLVLLIGVSRVYLGVHWPTDVLAGWCAGAAWALLWLMAARITAPTPNDP